MSNKVMAGTAAMAAAVLPSIAFAEETVLNSGDTAWMLMSTVLVLFMTIPGLSLFYAGMTRAKNGLSVMMQCFAITAVMTVIWALYGYSIAFGGEGAYWGGLDKLFLSGLTVDSMSGTIPESVFMTFQMTFAIITPALIVGAFAERMKFSAMLIFMVIWVTVIYAPITHWVWGDGGFLAADGVLDFAGGTVVHINAGVAGLVAAIVIGKRKGYQKTPMPPHNLMFTIVGAAMLWVGWFGFNAGSAAAADGTAGMAMAVTQIAAAMAAVVWMLAEWISHGKPSVLGIASGAVAGLVAITPAAGFVGPMGALAIGAASGLGCFIAAVKIKPALGFDDSLDAFSVHGIGGIIGALLTGVFCATSLGGTGFGGDNDSIAGQVMTQAYSIGVVLVYTAVVTFIILKVLDLLIGLRVTEEEETEGLDISQHDERAYIL
ncbi:MAG: ammonium transporter [Pseudomonadota bacterium]|nr:ammonium transporter [Pseudomonadota bacterium]